MSEENSSGQNSAPVDTKKRLSYAPFFIALGIAAVVVVAGLYVMSQGEKFKPVGVGTRAYDFELPNLEGKTVKLSDYAGKVIFLNFWATWCEPCKEEMPSMEQLSGALNGQPFVVIAVSIDSEKAEVVKEFTDSYRLTFPIVHDRKGKIRDLFKTTGVPETYMIDQDGVIAEKVLGGRNWADKNNLQVVSYLLQNGPMKPEEYKNFYKDKKLPSTEDYGSQTIY